MSVMRDPHRSEMDVPEGRAAACNIDRLLCSAMAGDVKFADRLLADSRRLVVCKTLLFYVLCGGAVH